MAASFLHGVESIEVEKGARPIRAVKTAVVGLICTAPIGPINQASLILSDRQAQQFGPSLPGFSGPQALDAIFDQGSGTVIVVNVLDPSRHKTSIDNEVLQLLGDEGKTSKPALLNLILKSAAGDIPYTKDQDYRVDLLTGQITRLSTGTMPINAALKASYDYADPSKVTPADIIGSINAQGQRTGMKVLLDTYNLMGLFAKIIIAPAFCTLNSVATEMIALAKRLRGIALIDAPIGTTFEQVIQGRGSSGAINFASSSDRAVLCYPHVKVYDAATNDERLEPLSQRLAGVICAKDNDKGYWWSPSNTEIAGITGVERPLTAMINDASSEVNMLNEVGIVTLFNSFGTGIRVWGNRTAAWPSVTHPKNFINIRRTADMLNESVEYSMLQFIDNPINSALIDAIKESVNGFIRTLIARGALIDGKCSYDPSKNPTTEIALGHLTFDLDFMPPTPGERITFESFLNIDLLKRLGQAS